MPLYDVPASWENLYALFYKCCNQSPAYQPTQFTTKERSTLIRLLPEYDLKFNGPEWLSMERN